jgi:hypothetical protein
MNETWLIAAALVATLSSRAPSAELVDPVVTQRVVEGVHHVDGRFALPISSAAAWAVLSDYDRMGEFVSHMRRSAVKERRPGSLVVEQKALDEAFFVSKEVNLVLDVREKPLRSIEFKDISSRDFEVYRGSWKIREQGGGLGIRYHLEVKPRAATPAAGAGPIVRSNAIRLLGEVRAEMLRRGSPARVASTRYTDP